MKNLLQERRTRATTATRRGKELTRIPTPHDLHIQQHSKTMKGGHRSNRSWYEVPTSWGTKERMGPILPSHQQSRRLVKAWIHMLPALHEKATSYATTKPDDNDWNDRGNKTTKQTKMAKKISYRGLTSRDNNDASRGERSPRASTSFACKQALAFSKPEPLRGHQRPWKHTSWARTTTTPQPTSRSQSTGGTRGGPVGSWWPLPRRNPTRTTQHKRKVDNHNDHNNQSTRWLKPMLRPSHLPTPPDEEEEIEAPRGRRGPVLPILTMKKTSGGCVALRATTNHKSEQPGGIDNGGYRRCTGRSVEPRKAGPLACSRPAVRNRSGVTTHRGVWRPQTELLVATSQPGPATNHERQRLFVATCRNNTTRFSP
jgi:hypothetical protein